MSYKSCDGVYHSEPLSEHCEEVLKAPPGHFWITEPNPDGLRYIHMKLPSSRENGAYCAIPIQNGGSGGSATRTNAGAWMMGDNSRSARRANVGSYPTMDQENRSE